MTTMTFESAYSRLEEILNELNSGKVSLENALKLYEEADKLITWCNRELAQAEKKIEVLIKNREGYLLDTLGQPERAPLELKDASPMRSSL
jgi:exodeoxyribonuclease VII small subunit